MSESLRELREALEASVALVPSTMTHFETWPLMDRWIAETPKGPVHIDFYTDDRAGKVFFAPGMLTLAQLAWITDKAKLLSLKADNDE